MGKQAAERIGWDDITHISLSDAENESIRDARRAGFSLFFPMIRDLEAQDRQTLQSAREYLKNQA